MMIHIKPSPVADTRTCDWSRVSKEELLKASKQHISDVRQAFSLVIDLMNEAADVHDYDKITDIDGFHRDFATGFKETTWWENHRKVNRHHLSHPDGIPHDVNLIDVLDHVIDCVMAGMARSGSIYELKLPANLFTRAFQNTVELLKSHVIVDKEV
jgi:hypothetical protein